MSESEVDLLFCVIPIALMVLPTIIDWVYKGFVWLIHIITETLT